MRRLSCVAVFVSGALLLAQTGGAGEGGFKPLFNGKNLDGWKVAKKGTMPLDGKTESHGGRFKVVDGMIVIDYKMKGDSYIETQKEFGKDVHVRLEFNPGPGCNNDFFLRGTKFDINPKNLKTVKEGEWHTLDIIVTGDKVEHKINGQSVKTQAAKTKSSTFMIRAEFGAIQLRKLQVKE